MHDQFSVSCPKCGNEMDYIAAETERRLLFNISGGRLRLARYLCVACLWEMKVLENRKNEAHSYSNPLSDEHLADTKS